MWVQLLGGTAPVKFGRAKKRPKFGAISDNFWHRSRISTERIEILSEISTSGKRRYQVINYNSSSVDKNIWWTSTHPWSPLRVPCSMRLRSGHVTLPGAEFQPRKLSPQSDLQRGRPHVGFCPKFLVLLYCSTCEHLQQIEVLCKFV